MGLCIVVFGHISALCRLRVRVERKKEISYRDGMWRTSGPRVYTVLYGACEGKGCVAKRVKQG